MGKPHISIRKHICWDPHNGGVPSEPTSTVVLTSARSFYVDVRMLKANEAGQTSTEAGSSSFRGLDWAFAGMSTTLRSPIAGDAAEIMEWQHWIDSKHSTQESGNVVRDVGRCFPQPNGDTQELGKMVNPDTGLETEYEELWGALEIQSTEVDTDRKIAVVLQTSEKQEDGKNAAVCKGLVVRVGQFIQGLAVIDGHVTVERWAYDKYRREWNEVVRLGCAKLPCSKLFDPINIVEGEEISHGDLSWRVMEQYLWVDRSSGL
ncbi:hypothetical protein NA57DRAFT_77798 [Rhizodiscina lignyota]|uniref:Protein HRI1 n=1 Tax=Rhizodiscina lignyota TaxID=1504668 RepID=A0A9P4M7Q1_9PEZI|nr:hypothetical protein NA57DRAFT_77798 [Rhizodiscina lignyota]